MIEQRTTVVNIRFNQPYDIYVGRRNQRLHLSQHVFANPFKLGEDGDRDEVLQKYEEWLKNWYRQDFVYLDGELDRLRGKRLGCYCQPLACHADLLAMLADMSPKEREAWAKA